MPKRTEFSWSARNGVFAVVTKEKSVLVALMSDLFRIRLARPADAETIAWHRARMFQDMGEVPPNLFETFRAKSRDRLHDALAHGEYVGWLVSLENDANIVGGGAGVHLQRTLPHPLSRSALAEVASVSS